MGGFNQQAFNSFVVDSNVVGVSDTLIKLVSGRECNFYANWRVVLNDVYLMDTLLNFIMSFIDDQVEQGKMERPDCLYGVPDAATKLGVLLQFHWAKKSPNYQKGSHVLAMGRKQPKEHGKPEDKFFVGMPKGKTLVIEDTSTTGKSVIESIDLLLQSGVEVVGALGLTNRMEKTNDGLSVEEAIATRECSGKPIRYQALSTLPGLLPEICKKLNPSSEMKQKIEDYYARYGVQPVSIPR